MASAYAIYTQPAAPASMKPSSFRAFFRKPRNRKIIAASTGLLLMLALAGSGYSWWGKHQRKQFVASLGADPRKIMAAARSGQLSDSERQQAFQQVRESFRQRMDKTMDDYFALPAGLSRQAYLDRQINEMEARRKQFEARAATQPARTPGAPGGPGGPGGPANGRVARAESIPPARKAEMAQFMKDMQDRRVALGLPAMGPGRGR